MFSKFTVIKPVRSATAEAVTKFLEEEVILKFACPEILLTDNGVQYKSKTYSQLAESYGIETWFTALYFAAANPTECENKVIGNAKDDTDHKNWDNHIQEIANAINHSCHSGTKETPYYVNFGQHMAQHASEYRQFVDANETTEINRDSVIKMRKQVQARLNEARERAQKYYNLRTREVVYNANDIVYRENTILSDSTKHFSKKLSPRYVKCIVLEKTGTNTYKLKECDSGKTGIYHASKFRT